MSARGLAEPNSEPITCFSIRVRSSRLMLAVVSIAGWMLVTTTRPRLAVMASAAASRLPSPTPIVMITLLAMRPHDASAIAGWASSSDDAVWVAPNCLARSRLDSSGSIAQICLAPARRAPCSALAPMPPMPTTATTSPGPTSAA